MSVAIILNRNLSTNPIKDYASAIMFFYSSEAEYWFNNEREYTMH